jgi:hypothetical protein
MTTTNRPRSPRSTLRCCLPVKLRLVLRAASGDVERLCPACDGRHVKQKKWLGEMGEKRFGARPSRGRAQSELGSFRDATVLFCEIAYHSYIWARDRSASPPSRLLD